MRRDACFPGVDDPDSQCGVCGVPTCIVPGRRCETCSVLFGQAHVTDDLVNAHHELYFLENPELGMTPAAVLQQYLEFVNTSLPFKGMRVLDIGCGFAVTGNLVRKSGGEYVGVEPNGLARKRLSSDGHVVFDALDAVPQDMPFDCVLMIEVLEHLLDPLAALNAAYAKLRPEGVLFVTTPNSLSARSRLLGHRWEQFENCTHAYLYTREAVTILFDRAGFRRARWMSTVVLPRNPLRQLASIAMQLTGLDGGLRVAVLR